MPSTLAEQRSTVPRSRRKGGPGDRPEPDGSGQGRIEASCLTDANGIPLAVGLTGANVHDSTMLEAMVDAVPPIRQCWGPPRKRPGKLHTDKAYDNRRCRRSLRRRRVQSRIARRGIESSTRLGRHRWVVERTLAWFGQFRRLAVRYERRADLHLALLLLAAALITYRFVQKWFC